MCRMSTSDVLINKSSDKKLLVSNRTLRNFTIAQSQVPVTKNASLQRHIIMNDNRVNKVCQPPADAWKDRNHNGNSTESSGKFWCAALMLKKFVLAFVLSFKSSQRARNIVLILLIFYL